MDHCLRLVALARDCARDNHRMRGDAIRDVMQEAVTMRVRTLGILALSAPAGGACDDDDNTAGVNNTATVRFANATGTSMDAALAGTVGTGNGGIAYGGSSSCMTVNTSGTAGTGLSFNQAGTSTSIPGFSQSFTS